MPTENKYEVNETIIRFYIVRAWSFGPRPMRQSCFTLDPPLIILIFLGNVMHVISVPLTAQLLLFTKIYHNFRCTLSFSLTSDVHTQSIDTRKIFDSKVL